MDGLLLINKETNMTSHDVVAILRRILQTKKIGHSGTLDPNARGVLLVLVGKATKILPYLENSDKVYNAHLRLGLTTTTDDIWGETIETRPIQAIENFQDLLNEFAGKQKQLPPMISSIKINGKKLYEYARNNEVIERPLRDVEVYSIEDLGKEKDDYCFRAHVSSGTYVRSLCRDLATRSNNLGCMSSLVREKVGQFDLSQCQTLEDIKENGANFISINEALSHLERVELVTDFDVLNGKKLHLNCQSDRVVMVYQEQVLAIYERHHGDVFACARGLW